MVPLGLLVVLAAAPLRVVLAEPADPELARRVQNQVGDLPIELISIVETTRGATLALDRARGLAAAVDGADVAAFMDAGPGESFLLSVANLRSATVMTRKLSGSKKRGARLRGSAARESVALALRASLQALASGGEEIAVRDPSEVEDDRGRVDAESGDDDERLNRTWIRESIPRPAPPTDRSERRTEAPPLGRAPAPSRGRDLQPEDSIPVSLFAGWGFGVAGRDIPLTQAFIGRGAASLGRLELGLQLEVGTPTSLVDARAEIDVSRHAALVQGALRFEPDERVDLVVRAGVGASLHRRTTQARDPLVRAAPPATDATFTGHIGAGLRTRIVSRVWVEAGAGIDVVPGAPRLAYQREETVDVRARFRVLQPRFQVGVFLSDL